MNKVNFRGDDNNESCVYTDHQFIIINDNNKWYIVDSYIGHKELEYKGIDINTFAKFICNMRSKFDIGQWNKFFNVNDSSPNAMSAYCIINQYKYKNTIYEKFLELIVKTRQLLIENGSNCKYLYILNNERLSKNICKCIHLHMFLRGFFIQSMKNFWLFEPETINKYM